MALAAPKAEALEKDVPSFGAIYKDVYGREQQEYRLDREQALTVVSGYDIPLRHRVVMRVAELEQQAALTVRRYSRISGNVLPL